MSSIEINGSFYSLRRPESYRAWYEATPEGFVFSIKGSLSAKGAGWRLMRRAPVAPLVVNEPVSCNNPIGVSDLLLWTPLVGVSRLANRGLFALYGHSEAGQSAVSQWLGIAASSPSLEELAVDPEKLKGLLATN